MVTHASNLNSQEVEARGSQVLGLLGGYRVKTCLFFFFSKKKRKKKKVIHGAKATVSSLSLARIFPRVLGFLWRLPSESGP